ncbi:DUF523 domain-containing protein [Thalassotalea sp. SU-HH00458]|uniref:DUF523 domain-containing protein n=1 Tax=Thalassotalea sp. SU-HH00458 TaxID=3127657 RepID=UPI00310BE3BE
MIKILVSACFLGEKVRYDGTSQQLLNQSLLSWIHNKQVVSFCPEIAGGLPVPRQPAEIQAKSQRILTCDGVDVSAQFNKGAQRALTLCQQHHIRFALLKESSPSCGSTTIYDGTFTQEKMSGEGVTTKLLRQHGVRVFSENNITALIAELASFSEKPSPH